MPAASSAPSALSSLPASRHVRELPAKAWSRSRSRGAGTGCGAGAGAGTGAGAHECRKEKVLCLAETQLKVQKTKTLAKGEAG